MEQPICVQSDLRSCVPMVASDRRSSGYGRGVACCLPRCGLRYRDACQLSQEPLGDAEQVSLWVMRSRCRMVHSWSMVMYCGLVHVSIV